MIKYSEFGRVGNLGNQLFQYASLIGLSKSLSRELVLPQWKYSEYFNHQFPFKKEAPSIIKPNEIRERKFEYDPEYWSSKIQESEIVNIHGYLQSEKYFEGVKDEVKKVLTFKQEYIDKCKELYKDALSKPCIAISVRRGDYIDNSNYELLPITYYIKALLEKLPFYRGTNILLFSDDLEYCKVHFECLDNVYFSDNLNDIGQLCLMSLCTHFVIANSTFSWWGAYLGEKEDSIIIRPNYLFNGKLLEKEDSKDFYPKRWTMFDHKVSKIKLDDTTIVIPVKYDHRHREENLDLVLKQLQQDFDVKIFVGEQGLIQKFRDIEVKYHYFRNMKEFHRTRMLNYMITNTDTNIVVNYDADVFIPPLQFYLAIQKIKEGVDMIYPYDGKFNRMGRSWYKLLFKYLDIGILRDTEFYYKKGNVNSVGGCIIYNKASFIDAGMENEEFVSFSDEDNERSYRFRLLGYEVERSKGALYHLDHWCGIDSSTNNPHWSRCRELWNWIKTLNREQMLEYIKEKFIWAK